MNFLTLATNYDGTLAHDGRVSPNTVSALEKLRDSGRKLVLVSGRVLDDLLTVFPNHDLFDRVVAENGAVLYCTHSCESRVVAEPVPDGLVEALRARAVISVLERRSSVHGIITNALFSRPCAISASIARSSLTREL
jgi:hydroxymethylpyrimidine pyrophosphatase-like HAD family hydrolase